MNAGKKGQDTLPEFADRGYDDEGNQPGHQGVLDRRAAPPVLCQRPQSKLHSMGISGRSAGGIANPLSSFASTQSRAVCSLGTGTPSQRRQM